jgi:thiamine kinase
MRLDQILTEIEPITGKNLQVTRLENALTNACYQITSDNKSWALRRNNERSSILGIDRYREARILSSAQASGFTATVVAQNYEYLLTKWVYGQHWQMEIDPDLSQLIELIDRVHHYPTASFQNTKPLDIRHQIKHLSQTITLPHDVDKILDKLIDNYLPAAFLCLCHHDWHPGNLIIADSQMILIDWEYAALGDPVIDLACAVTGFDLDHAQQALLLEIAGVSAERFKIALALVEMMSLLWFQCRYPMRNWADRYLNWLSRWDSLR